MRHRYIFLTGIIMMFGLVPLDKVLAQDGYKSNAGKRAEPTLKPFDATIITSPTKKPRATKEINVKTKTVKTKQTITRYHIAEVSPHYLAVDGTIGWKGGLRMYDGFMGSCDFQEAGKTVTYGFGVRYFYNWMRFNEVTRGISLGSGVRYWYTHRWGQDTSYPSSGYLRNENFHYIALDLAGFQFTVKRFLLEMFFGIGYSINHADLVVNGEPIRFNERGGGGHVGCGIDYKLTDRIGMGVSFNYVIGGTDKKSVPVISGTPMMDAFSLQAGIRFYLGK